jgi:hypothetical protein
MLDWPPTLQFTPDLLRGQKIRAPFSFRLTRQRGLLAVGAAGWRQISCAGMSKLRRLSYAQAAPDVAAAEEILVPMNNSILAGPANRAIAFRG